MSTAVGSSKTRILAPRKRILRISTRCWRPTDELLDPGVEVHDEPVLLHEGGDLPPLALRWRAPRPVGFLPDDDVLQHGEGREEHEVLVHHADAPADGVPGTADGDRVSLDRDGSRVRPVQAVEDLHQGGLAGAVLPDQGVDLPGAQVEGDVVVRRDAGEAAW